MLSSASLVVLPVVVAGSGMGVGPLLAAVDAGALQEWSHDQLSASIAAIRAQQAQLEAAALAIVAEVDARGSHVDDGALNTAAWLRMHTRATPGEARAAVRTARVLRSGLLPATAAALSDGRISGAHAAVLAGAVVDAPAGAVTLIEGEALQVAEQADANAVRSLMRRFQEALDCDGNEAAALRRWERRGLTLSPMPDGTVHITGLADEVTGALLATAIDVAAGPPGTHDRRTAAARRLDAWGEVARVFLSTAPEATGTGGGRAQLIVTIDADTVTGSANGGDPAALERRDATSTESLVPAGGTLTWVGPVTAETARRVGCDATVTLVAIDQRGAAATVGTQRRYYTPAQRRAMIARDGDRCPVPFCDRPTAWADAHHLTHWARGGPTTIENGALPCAGHHQLLHEGGWTLTRLSDGRYLITNREGRTIGPERDPPGHRRPARGPAARDTSAAPHD